MKPLSLIVLLYFLAGCSDDSDNDQSSIPECIQAEIKKIENSKVRNPPGAVYQYTYKEQTVYYIPPYCCDIAGRLLNESCEIIGCDGGGFDGKSDEICEDFHNTRTNEVVLWEDNRTN
jgi:hypothetical protein